MNEKYYDARIRRVFNISGEDQSTTIAQYALVEVNRLKLRCFVPSVPVSAGFKENETSKVNFKYLVGNWNKSKEKIAKLLPFDAEKAEYSISGEIINTKPSKKYPDKYEILVDCGLLIHSTANKEEKLGVGDWVEAGGRGNRLDVYKIEDKVK